MDISQDNSDVDPAMKLAWDGIIVFVAVASAVLVLNAAVDAAIPFVGKEYLRIK